MYLAYTRIRAWKGHIWNDLSGPDRVALEVAYQEFSEALSAALKAANLSQPFSASLITGFSIQDAGTDTGDKAGAAAGGVGLVAFESMHFFARPNRVFDAGLSGVLGFSPALVVAESAGEGEQTSTRYAEYRPSFTWSVHVEPNFRVADLAEVSGFVGIGQHILSSTTSLMTDGDQAGVAVLSGRSDTGATFYEVGVKLGVYAESLDLLHLSQGLLSPAFGFAVGLRRDERFAGIEAPGDPQNRLFIRLSTSALQLDRKRSDNSPFTLTFALEHERAVRRGAGSVPQGTRVLIRGDLNLFRVAQD